MSNLFEPTALVVPFEKLRMSDVEIVGGKNASLGEMISQLPQGVKVPTGFATTAHAFREFLGSPRGRTATLKNLRVDDWWRDYFGSTARSFQRAYFAG